MKLSWRQIYWKIYSHTLDFECKTCGNRFTGPYSTHWYYHSGKPVFSFGSNKGTFSCCNKETLRFDTSIKEEGWEIKHHTPKSDLALFEKLLDSERISLTQEPFYSNKNAKQDEINNYVDHSNSKLDDKSQLEISIVDAVIRYNKEIDNNWILQDEGEDDNEEEDFQALDFPRTNSINNNNNSPTRLRSNSKSDSKPNVADQKVSNNSQNLQKQSITNISKVDTSAQNIQEQKEINQETEDVKDESDNKLGLSQNLTVDKVTNNTSSELQGESELRNVKSPLKKKRNKKTKSLVGPPSFIKGSAKAMREYIRDTRRTEDRDNMNQLMMDLRQLRRDENNKNIRIIKKKDIRQVRKQKDLPKKLPQSKRMIFKSNNTLQYLYVVFHVCFYTSSTSFNFWFLTMYLYWWICL